MLIPDYLLPFTSGYQIRFRSVPSGIKNVQKYRVVLGFLKRARAGLRVENHATQFQLWRVVVYIAKSTTLQPFHFKKNER